jgi:signal transduction histidine kinase
MAAHITHEVRNPLASIGLYVELLGDELPPGDAAGRRLLDSLAAEVDRLSEITETYLRFVRLPKPKLEREDLGAIVAAVMEFARAELAKAGVSLEMNLTPGLPEVAADENQVRQALLNLVRNAREAMAAGGSLRVALAADGSPEESGWLRLSIADTGPGIAPDNLAKIFDPFFSTKAKGTGLGLALVHQIVAEHGGRIEVDCPPNGGTTFVITLPIVAQLSERASVPAAIAPVAEPAGVAGPVVPQAS